MKAKSVMLALAIFALAASGAARAGEPEAPVAVNVAGLQPHVAAQVKKHAAQGMTALSRYLERTRRQNGLYVEDVVGKPDTPARSRAPSQPKEFPNYARVRH